jgi:hypothetical protein
MAFGDEIGGFRFVKPKNLARDDLLDDALGDVMQPSKLDDNLTRSLTRIFKATTQLELVKISNLLDKTLQIEGLKEEDAPAKWKDLRKSLETLFIENRDFGKSLQRLLQDAKTLQNIGSGFLKKIRSQLFTPLKTYISSIKGLSVEQKKELEDDLKLLDLNLSSTGLEASTRQSSQRDSDWIRK